MEKILTYTGAVCTFGAGINSFLTFTPFGMLLGFGAICTGTVLIVVTYSVYEEFVR